jgi:hypothetical protein
VIDRRGNASTADIIASRKCADDQLPLQTIATTTLNGIWRTHTLTSLTVMMRLDIEATVDVTPDRASTRRWSLGDERPSTFLLQALIGLFIPSQVLSPMASAVDFHLCSLPAIRVDMSEADLLGPGDHPIASSRSPTPATPPTWRASSGCSVHSRSSS